MIRYFLLILLSIVNICKAQDMEVTIQLNNLIEEKELFEQNNFLQKFEKPVANTGLVLKNTQKLFTGALEILYPTGEKFADYNYVNGIQEGKQTIFFKNGNTQASLTLDDGKYDEAYTLYYENGKTKSSSVFQKGKQISLQSFTDAGVKKAEFLNNVIGDKKEEYIYYDSGNLMSLRIYKKTHVEVTNFYDFKKRKKKSEGLKIRKRAFFIKLPKDGIWKYYYENGKLKEEGGWGMGGIHGKDNIKIGVWKTYTKKGELLETKQHG